jgi:hypothetical protein
MAAALRIIRGGWALEVGAIVWLLLVLFLPEREVACGGILLMLCVEPFLPMPVLVAIGTLAAILVWRVLKSTDSLKPLNVATGWAWIAAAAVAIEIFFLSAVSFLFLNDVVDPRIALVTGCSSIVASVVLAATSRRVFHAS